MASLRIRGKVYRVQGLGFKLGVVGLRADTLVFSNFTHMQGSCKAPMTVLGLYEVYRGLLSWCPSDSYLPGSFLDVIPL